MSYVLFIDDERFPTNESSVIVRSSAEAIQMLLQRGMPSHIDFDHDLGGDDTSIRFIWMMVDALENGTISIPEGFTFAVHSQNPVGKVNIEHLMKGVIANFRVQGD